ncbi:MAG: hypothetical protein AAFV93_24755, partial [Chloroflexota bacterium]
MLIIPPQWRQWSLFLASIILIFSLQPNIFVRWMDFILPMLTLGLTVMSWAITHDAEYRISHQDILAGFLIIGIVVLLAMLRYVDADWRWFIPSRPPSTLLVLLLIFIFGFLAVTLPRLSSSLPIFLLVMIGIFLVLKTDFLAETVSAWWRSRTGQDVSQASSLDL